MIRWFITLLIGLLVLASISATLLLTPTGLNITLLAAKKLAPGEFNYKTADGVLIGPIDITGLTYKNENIDLSVGTLHLQWRALALLLGRLTISDFTADHINLSTTQSKNSTPSSDSSSGMPSLNLPLALRIDYLQFNDISLHEPDIQREFQFKSLSIRDLDAQKKLSGKITAVALKPYPVNLFFDLSGDLSDYRFEVKAKNRWMDWQLFGEGNAQQLQCTVKTGHTMGGQFSGNAALQWVPQKQWDINLNASKINLSILDPYWPKQLNLKLKTKGTTPEKAWPNFTLNTTLQTPGNTLHISGTHNKQWDLNWNINATKLSTFSEALSGQLNTKGSVTGPSKTPYIQGKLNGSSLALSTYQIGHIISDWKIDLAQHRTSKLQWKVSNFISPFARLSTLNANIKHQPTGERTHANLILSSNLYGSNKIDASFYGASDNNFWKGVLTEFSLTSQTLGAWRLNETANLKFSKTHFGTTPLCWSSEKQTICLEGAWDQGSAWGAKIHGKQLSLDRLLSLLSPANLLSKSTVNLDSEIAGYEDQLNLATLKATVTPGKINLDKLRNKNSTFAGADFNLLIKNHQLTTDLNADPSEKEKIRLHAILPWDNFTPQLDKPMKGQLIIQTKNSNFINALTEQTAVLSGNLNGDLTLAGTLEKPMLNGSIALPSGGIKIPALRIELKTPKLAVSTQGDATDAILTTTIDKEMLTIKGRAKLDLPNLSSATVTIKGRDLQLMNSLEYTAYVTPDLMITLKDKTLKTTGTVTIPKARLRPLQFGGTTSLPEDVVFSTQNEKPTSAPWKILTNIKVALGDDVKIDTSGVTARLTGGIDISKANQDQAMVGNGTINIVDGKINTHGHELTIKPNSTIAFANSPISNPNLDITVIRVISSITQIGANAITVGVYLQGSATTPKVTFFSYPAHLSQADILSYLILGHSSSANSAADVTTLLQSVDFFHLGGESSSGLMSEVTQGLGLSEFGVQSGTSFDALGTPVGYNQSAFVVGRYLTRHIYLRYVNDLDYAVSVFQLRYIFNQSWLAQTESSTLGSGADILYTIQRPKSDKAKD